MKKRFLALPALLSFALAGCNPATPGTPADSDSNPTSSAPSSAASSSSDGSSSSASSEEQNTIEEVISILSDYASADRYAVQYVENGSDGNPVTLKDIYTPDYISIGYASGGYVTLDSIDAAAYGAKMVYSFRYGTDGSIILGKSVTYYDDKNALKPVASCSDMDYLNLFLQGQYTLSPSQFSKRGNLVATKDENVLYVLSNLMGYSSYNSDVTIVSATFSVDNGALTFALNKQIDTDSTETEVLTTATLMDIDSASDGKLATFVADYKVPENRPSQAIADSLTAEVVGFDTTIAYRTDSGFQTLGTTQVIQRKGKDESQDAIAYSYTDITYDETHTYLLTRGENDKALDTYIDGSNTVQTVPFDKSDYYFGNGLFFIQDELDISGFASTTTNDFFYYGINYDRLYESIAALNVLTDLNIKDIISFTIHSDDGSLSIIADLDAYYYDTEGNAIDISVRATSNLIKDPQINIPTTGYSADADSQALQKSFDDTFSSSFHASGHGVLSTGSPSQTLPSNDYYLKKGEYLIERIKDRGTYVQTISGYKQTADGLIPFTVDKQGNATSSGALIKGKSLADMIGWTVSPEVFKKLDANTYGLKDNVKKAYQNMIGGSAISGMIETTFKINLTDDGKIDNTTYSYVANGLLFGNEELSFKYGEDLAFPDIVNKDSYDALTATEGTISSWLEEKNSLVKKMFTKTFGDKASEIPYLYDAKVSGNWSLGTNYDDTGDFVIYNSAVKGSDYFARYETLLKEKGFTEKTVGSHKYLVKDGIRIRFGVTESETADYSDSIYFGLDE